MRKSYVIQITTMKLITHPIFKAAMLVALTAGVLVSCNSKKNTKEVAESNVVAESLTQTSGMPFEEFNRQFIEILTQKDLMQSALAGKVEKLCVNLNLRLLEQMLEQASGNAPDGVSEENWLLGYNQLMALAGSTLGGDATEAFYRLAANTKASSVMRDYASQHYLRTESRVLIQLQAFADNEVIHTHLQQVLDKAEALVTGPHSKESTLAGTTLLGIAALSMPFEKHPDEYRLIQNKVNQLTMPVLQKNSAHNEGLQCAAMQAASKLEIEEAGSLILKTAMDQSASFMVRLNAIGALKHYPELVNAEQLKASCRRNDKLVFACKSLVDHK